METSNAIDAPWAPPGTTLHLDRAGDLLVRDSGGPADRPTLVLLHGWMATADLNFGFEYAALAEDFRVIAFDQRGHGGGLPAHGRFSFSRAADDIAAVLDALDVERAIAVGYSMGGPVALSFARRHPDRAAGMVLCATAGRFSRYRFTPTVLAPVGALIATTGLIPESRLRIAARRRFISRRATGRYSTWIADQLERSDPTAIAQAGVALARFDARPWLGSIDAPSVSVVTVDDQLVSPDGQRALSHALATAGVVEVTGGHTTCFDHPEVFAPALVRACRTVADASA